MPCPGPQVKETKLTPPVRKPEKETKQNKASAGNTRITEYAPGGTIVRSPTTKQRPHLVKAESATAQKEPEKVVAKKRARKVQKLKMEERKAKLHHRREANLPQVKMTDRCADSF